MHFKEIIAGDAVPSDKPMDISRITAENLDAEVARRIRENYYRFKEDAAIENASKVIMDAANRGHHNCDVAPMPSSDKFIKHFRDRGFDTTLARTGEYINISWLHPATV